MQSRNGMSFRVDLKRAISIDNFQLSSQNRPHGSMDMMSILILTMTVNLFLLLLCPTFILVNEHVEMTTLQYMSLLRFDSYEDVKRKCILVQSLLYHVCLKLHLSDGIKMGSGE